MTKIATPDRYFAGAAAEQNRIRAILEHDEARGRAPLARFLALEIGMSVEQAVAALRCAGRAGDGRGDDDTEHGAREARRLLS